MLIRIWSYILAFALTNLIGGKMNHQHFSPSPSLLVSTFTTIQEDLRSQLSQKTASDSEEDRAGLFKQPDYPNDAPRRRERGTASRGNCILGTSGTAGKVMLSAIVPAQNWGLTVSQSPRFWIKVAYDSDNFEPELLGKFYLEKADTNERLPLIVVRLPKTSSVLDISLPYSLEVNQWYRWYLLLDCPLESSSSRNTVLWVEGLVQRIERSNLESQLEIKTSEQRITFYAKEGIWYDALDEAAKLRCRNLQNSALAKLWLDLLKDDDVGLEQLAQVQLVCPKLPV